MKKIKVAINGFGRIGRLVYRLLSNKEEFDVVAVNDLTDPKTLSHLLKYDSVHGIFNKNISSDKSYIYVGENKVLVTTEREPDKLPWASLDVDIVIEASGVFREIEGANKHILAGAKRVLLTVPPKGKGIKMFVCGVNDNELSNNDIIVSNASCTTNCLAPLAKILDKNFGIRSGLMTTIHAATNDQRVIDAAHSDLRRARSSFNNIIPTSTGAAKAVAKVLPGLDSKLNGMAVRVPVQDGSLVDLSVILEKDVSIQELNKSFESASEQELKGILQYSKDELVSSDIIGNSHSCIYDSKATMKIQNNLFKILAWYDNEWGYSSRVIDIMLKMSKHLV